MVPRRLRRLPALRGPGGLRVYVACSFRARLLGLALLGEIPAGWALLIPSCSSVHTFAMRFRIDVAFLDRAGQPLRLDRRVRPGRVLRCPGAEAVLEWRSDAAPPPRAMSSPRAP